MRDNNNNADSRSTSVDRTDMMSLGALTAVLVVTNAWFLSSVLAYIG